MWRLVACGSARKQALPQNSAKNPNHHLLIELRALSKVSFSSQVIYREKGSPPSVPVATIFGEKISVKPSFFKKLRKEETNSA